MLSKLKNYFFLTLNLFGVALVLSIVMIAIEYVPAFYRALSGFDGSQDYVYDSTSQFISVLLERLSAVPFADTLITALIWGLCGLVAYTIFHLFANTFIDARNRMYVAADRSTDGFTALEVVRAEAGKFGMVVGLVMFAGLTVFTLIGYWMQMVYIYVYSEFAVQNIHLLFLGFIGLTVNLYILFVLSKIVWNSSETVVV